MDRTEESEKHLDLQEWRALPHVMVNAHHQIEHLSESANRYLRKNESTNDILNLTREELRSVLEEGLGTGFSEGYPSRSPTLQIQLDSEICQVELIFCSVHDENSAASKTLIIFNEHKHLQRSDVMLARAQQVANLGSWEYHIDRDEIIWSDQLYRIFGLDPHHANPNWEDVLQYIPVEDHRLFDRAFEEAMHHGRPVRLEHRIRRPDGEERWALVQAEPVFDAEGRPVQLDGTVLDITERKRSEHALRESEHRWRCLVENLAEPLFVSRGGVVLYANAATVRLVGAASPEELVGRTLEDFVVPALHDRLRERLEEIEQRGVVPPMEYEMLRLDGEIRIVESTGSFIIYEGERAVQSILRDITERKRAEQSLRQSEARSRAILQGIPDLIFRLSSEGVYHDIETTGDAPLVAPSEQLLGRNISEVLPVPASERIQQAIEATLSTGEMQRTEYSLTTLDGSEHEFEARITPISQDEVLLLVRDVTRQRRLEREVLRISTLEQQRIGRDLHDMLGSHLTGILMLAQSQTRALEDGESLSAGEMKELTQLIKSAVEQVRVLSRGLNPVRLDEQGLAGALREMVNDTARISGLRCTFRARGEIPEMENEIALQLYWIAQEAITNVLRHAHSASSLDVRLMEAGNRLILSIRDNGAGIPNEKTAGMGIDIMRFRADMIRATFSIENAPGGGTLVRCILPL